MIYFKNGVRIYPNVCTCDDGHLTLHFTQSHFDRLNKYIIADNLFDKTFIMGHQRHVAISGLYPNLESFCKEYNLNKGLFLKKLLSRELFKEELQGINDLPEDNEIINVYLNTDDYWDIWFIYIMGVLGTGRIQLIHRLYHLTLQWFYFCFGRKGLNYTVSDRDSDYIKETMCPYKQVGLDEIQKLMSKNAPFVSPIEDKDVNFELSLAKVILGENSELVETVVRTLYKQNIAGDLRLFKNSSMLNGHLANHDPFEVEWLIKVSENPDLISEMPHEILNYWYDETSRFIFNQPGRDVSFINKPESILPILREDIKHIQFNLALLTTPDRARTVNTFIIADIIRNKDNLVYLKQYT